MPWCRVRHARSGEASGRRSDVERPLKNARLPASGPDVTDLGIVAVTGIALLATRTVLAETWISFHRGTVGAASWPAFDGVGIAAFTMAMLWLALILVLKSRHRRPLSVLDARLIGIAIACAMVCAIPGEQWRLATAHVAGARQAPLNWIVRSAGRDDMALLRYLLSHGASANARATNGQTALGAAAAAGHLAACELLITSGARLNDRTALTRETALIEAAQENHPEVVGLLLARGADPEARDFAGLTAEDWATINGNRRIQQLLRARQALNQPNYRPSTQPAALKSRLPSPPLETRIWSSPTSRDPRLPS
jgi:hypothetical protein